MPPGYPGKHHESGTATGGIIQPPCTASSLCIFPKEPHPPQNRGDGVSTYLALTFGTLLSSQGTDASFKTIPGFSGRFPSMFPTLSDFSGPEFRPRDSAGTRWRHALVRGGVVNVLDDRAGMQ